MVRSRAAGSWPERSAARGSRDRQWRPQRWHAPTSAAGCRQAASSQRRASLQEGGEEYDEGAWVRSGGGGSQKRRRYYYYATEDTIP